MAAELKDQGLVLIGIHTARDAQKMGAYVAQERIGFPVAIDSTGATKARYLVDGYPDYWLIDRDGNVRVADLANGDVESAVRALLAESDANPSELARAASESAVRTYEFVRGGQSIGTWTAGQRIVRGSGGLLEMTDVVKMSGAGGFDMTYTVRCAIDERWSPVTLSASGTSSDEDVVPYSVATRAGRLAGSRDGQSWQIDLDTKLVLTEFALTRPPACIAFEAGTVTPFTLLDGSTLETTKNHYFRCVGEKTIRVGGAPTQLWRFDHTGPGRRGTYWFDAKRVLRAATIQGESTATTEIRLTSGV